MCSVDRWANLLVSYSTADPSCGEPQSPALGALLCILEIPCSSQGHPLAPGLPLSSPPASSEALPKCLSRTGGGEEIPTGMGPLFPTASLPESRHTREIEEGSLFTLELLRLKCANVSCVCEGPLACKNSPRIWHHQRLQLHPFLLFFFSLASTLPSQTHCPISQSLWVPTEATF